jgi:transcriptional regulator with XRE-family HTH domain
VKLTASEFFTRPVWSQKPIPCTLAGMPARKPRYRRTFIREWRQNRGLTLEQLGERIDMTPSNLSMLERGQRGYAQETLEKIADALQTEVASLLMRNPTDRDAIWSIWERAQAGERETIVDLAETILRRRSN